MIMPNEHGTSERLTREQMNEQFAGQWVLIEECVTDDDGYVVAGCVLYHDADRDAVYRSLGERRPRNAAVLYAGKRPTHLSFAL